MHFSRRQRIYHIFSIFSSQGTNSQRYVSDAVVRKRGEGIAAVAVATRSLSMYATCGSVAHQCDEPAATVSVSRCCSSLSRVPRTRPMCCLCNAGWSQSFSIYAYRLLLIADADSELMVEIRREPGVGNSPCYDTRCCSKCFLICA